MDHGEQIAFKMKAKNLDMSLFLRSQEINFLTEQTHTKTIPALSQKAPVRNPERLFMEKSLLPHQV